MSGTIYFDSPVLYIRDVCQSSSRHLPLARAVMIAIAEYRKGMTPFIVGNEIELVGIKAIRAVYDLEIFPKFEV